MTALKLRQSRGLSRYFQIRRFGKPMQYKSKLVSGAVNTFRFIGYHGALIVINLKYSYKPLRVIYPIKAREGEVILTPPAIFPKYISHETLEFSLAYIHNF